MRGDYDVCVKNQCLYGLSLFHAEILIPRESLYASLLLNLEDDTRTSSTAKLLMSALIFS